MDVPVARWIFDNVLSGELARPGQGSWSHHPELCLGKVTYLGQLQGTSHARELQPETHVFPRLTLTQKEPSSASQLGHKLGGPLGKPQRHHQIKDMSLFAAKMLGHLKPLRASS